jgi:beta-lactamase superfamily II metal-dependent hydrolase
VLVVLDEDLFIFTGYAGIPALDRAISPKIAAQVRSQLKYFQAPHHGSKRNVGPMILDRILGPRVALGASTNINAFISAAKDGEPKHPSKQVTNAAIRRGARVFATQGQNHLYKSADIQMRAGYSPLTAIAFSDDYDEE